MKEVIERLLRSDFGDRLYTPSDTGYDEVRRVFNGAIDGRPVAIARCNTVEDIQRAVRAAATAGVQVSVRGGGHNVAGSAVRTGTLCVDLSRMCGVKVSPEARTARAGPGTRLLEFDSATQRHSLATTMGIVSDTGLAGLTLGGGLGWLMGKHGLTCDNLIGADLVLADGSIEHVDQSTGDLLWALRGGGGNLGVVTSFEYSLHPQGAVTAGSLKYRVQDAADALLRYDSLSDSFPDEVTGSPALVFGSDGGQYLSIDICHSGAPDSAEACLAELRDDRLVVMDNIRERSYCDWQRYLDDPFRAGRRSYWKSMSLWSLTEDFVRLVVERFTTAPSRHIMLTFDHLHGAVQRVAQDATAFGDRSMKYEFLLNVNWESADQDPHLIRWTRDLYEDLRPFARRTGVYMNYLDRDDQARASDSIMGADLDRLRSIKRQVDPENLFPGTAPVVSGGEE